VVQAESDKWSLPRTEENTLRDVPTDPADSPPSSQQGPPSPEESPEWVEKIPLPNGLSFYLTNRQMLGAAHYLRKEIFVRNRYYRPGFEIRPNDTVVDVGANMGMFVMWAAPQAAQGRVVAIEPMSVIQCVDLNARLNGLENVTSLRVAVGKLGSELEFVEYPGFNIVTHQVGVRPAVITRLLINLLYFRYKRQPVRSTAPCVPLGKIMDDQGLRTVNYLKIDCEGGEYEAFRDLSPEHWQRIERIAMEFHELRPDQRHQELTSRLEQQGFHVEVRKRFFEYRFMKFGEIWAWRPGA